MKIQKVSSLVILLCLMIGCTAKQDKVERIVEDGVEVILNRMEPYSISGADSFALEKTWTIDTENDETAEMGLAAITHFNVDSEGKIFFLNRRAKNNCIFVFDKEGGFITAFGNRGEGPGEFQNPIYIAVSDEDEIIVTDRGKIVMFDNSGEYKKELRIDREYQRIIPLNKERYLAIAVKMNEDLSQSFQALLCSSEFEELKILDSAKIASFMGMDKVNIIPTLLYWETSKEFVYTGNTDEYEIRMFDFNGKLVRKIRKKYEAVLLADDDKENYEQQRQKYPPEIKEKFFIPDAYPPIRNIAALRDNRLFVQTYEVSTEDVPIYDVFSSEGVFINRIAMEGTQVKFSADKVYCLKEKSSAYQEFIVYRMIRK